MAEAEAEVAVAEPEKSHTQKGNIFKATLKLNEF